MAKPALLPIDKWRRSEASMENHRAYNRGYSERKCKRARALGLCHRCRKTKPPKDTSTCIGCKRKLAILHLKNLKRYDRNFYNQLVETL